MGFGGIVTFELCFRCFGRRLNTIKFHFRNGIPSGQQNHQDWPWELMYEDLVWAIKKINDLNTSARDLRMAGTILQAWMGEVDNITVDHQNLSNQPIDA